MSVCFVFTTFNPRHTAIIRLELPDKPRHRHRRQSYNFVSVQVVQMLLAVEICNQLAELWHKVCHRLLGESHAGSWKASLTKMLACEDQLHI